MSNYWDNVPEEDFYDENEDKEKNGTYVYVNGSYVDVQPGSKFSSTIKEIARNAGLGKFRVFLNGVEIMPYNAPAIFEENDAVELRKYDIAG